MKVDIRLDHLKWRRLRDFGLTSCDSFATAVPHLTFIPMSHWKTIQRNWRRLAGTAALYDNDQPPSEPRVSMRRATILTHRVHYAWLSDVCEFSWEVSSLLDIWRSKRDKHKDYSLLVCVLVLLGKEEEKRKPYAFITSVDFIGLLHTKSWLDNSQGK